MNWSPFQEAIFDAVQVAEFQSILVNAVAGSGKTTTIVEVANRIPLTGIFLAFNKAIAEELGQKLPPHFPAKTFHALGMKILKDRLASKLNVSARKVSNLMNDAEVNKDMVYPVSQLVGRAKTYGIGIFWDIEEEEAWYNCLDALSLDVPKGFSEEQVVKMAQTFLQKSNSVLTTIDFDDMLYLPLLLQRKYGWDLKDYPVIIIDEAQDNNGIQLELLKQLTDKVIGVGDRNQAIYAFRGSDYTSMDLLSKAFNCQEFPLDVSYRCPQSVVREAQEIVPHIKAREDAPEGNVGMMELEEFHETDWGRDTMIVCRTNAPLMEVAFKRLKKQLPFTMLSNEPQKLIFYVKSIKAGGIQEFKTRLEEKHNAAMEALEKAGRKNRMAMEHDRFDSIYFLASQCDSVPMLEALLNKILYSKGGPALCTIHKSKGLERKNVVIFRADLLPAPWVVKNDKPEELQQEANLEYVAITRAQDELTYVYGEDDRSI